jgi:hypothetical protein
VASAFAEKSAGSPRPVERKATHAKSRTVDDGADHAEIRWRAVLERCGSAMEARSGERTGALVRYERTIETAFAEVSNSLIAHQKVRESREKQETLVGALQDRVRLA